ncbi:MAG: glycerol kinase GlpK [Erysipelothrix sp.]|nr:glycerol kinase GlpK [Erysipelothrix sp.]
MKNYIIALDQGTTSSRAIVFNKKHEVVASAHSEFLQIYPKPGWVEHDPSDLWASQSGVLNEVIAKAGISPKEIDSIAITNQRETTIVWDKITGKPIYNAIVWQCRRTQALCQELIEAGHGDYIKEATGLVVDAYFSATKIKWILDNVEGAQAKADKGELMFGTVDTWLIYKLTGGKVFATDYTNASRTMLFDIKNLRWDKKLLDIFNIPQSMLPKVLNSSDFYGEVNISGQLIPICAVIGDQQAALFGHTCFKAGSVKSTYGTGGFLLMNTKDKLVKSKHGLLSTISVSIDDKVEYAIEGSIFNAGSTIQWLRDELRLFSEADDTEYFSSKVSDNGGVYLVPAFTGLGAPYWDMDARGTIVGLTRGSNKNHLIRAGLESIAYQSYDILKAMENDSKLKISSIKVDGGASANNFLMQFQADILNTEIHKAKVLESSALGACFLAGLYTKFFDSKESLEKMSTVTKVYYPQMQKGDRKQYLKQWHKAVSRSLNWLE